MFNLERRFYGQSGGAAALLSLVWGYSALACASEIVPVDTAHSDRNCAQLMGARFVSLCKKAG